MEAILYEESPNGPLVNHIIDGKPVLADNWGFGIKENVSPYFDSGAAPAAERAYLERAANGLPVIVKGIP